MPEHYENFPVGSWLLPRRLRPHVHRIYAFARVADDLADEQQDLAALRAWREETRRALAGAAGTPRLLADLAATVEEFALPHELLFRLLDAFERDLVQSRYADVEDLMSYCRDSADPIGRLMLHLFGRAGDARNLELSDRICSALQIVNHCQDVKSDYVERDRIYVPRDMLADAGVTESELAGDTTPAGLRRCIAQLAGRCAEALRSGFELPRRLGGREGIEVRAILNGACLVLTKLRRIDYDVLRAPPKIKKRDLPGLLLRSVLPWRAPAC